jgi:hypothetical protein
VLGEAGIVLLAGEALFLCRANDAAVCDQCRGTVVIERRNTENARCKLFLIAANCLQNSV